MDIVPCQEVSGLTCFICHLPMVKSRTSAVQGKAAHVKCRTSVHGYTGYVRGCRCETCRAGKAARMQEWHAAYRAENGESQAAASRRLFREKNGYWPQGSNKDWISPKIRADLYERDAWSCYLCGSDVDRDGDPNGDLAPSLDHVIPRSRGGSDDPSNLKTAHRACNSKKSDRLDAEQEVPHGWKEATAAGIS